MRPSSKRFSKQIYMVVYNWHSQKWDSRFEGLLNNQIIDHLRNLLSLEAKEWLYCQLNAQGKSLPRKIRHKYNPIDDITHRKFIGKFEYRKCEICGTKAPIAAAHIIPRSAGGTDEDGNLMHLCENHHYLFDNLLLNRKELGKINWKKKSQAALWWYINIIIPSYRKR